LLLAALQVWETNVIAFALIYWELDRDGLASRVMRSRAEPPLADLRFSHDEDRDTVIQRRLQREVPDARPRALRRRHQF
jgi:hypothetical protein